jgi:hypothetical protein
MVERAPHPGWQKITEFCNTIWRERTLIARQTRTCPTLLTLAV